MTATATPPPDDGAWQHIRARYEQGHETVRQIAETIGLSGIVLSKRAKAWGWTMRGTAKVASKAKVSTKAETTAATIKRLKDLLQSRITQLEVQIDDIGKDISALANEREIRAVNTLVRTLEKVLDLERKDRSKRKKTDIEFKRFDEQQRVDLADKIGRLQQTWRGETDGENAADAGSGGTEQPVALLGEAGPTTAA
jgi:hypothetical protein